MAHEDDALAGVLDITEQTDGAVSHLCQGAGERLALLGGDGLYGVDDDKVRIEGSCLLVDTLEGCFAEDVEGGES